MSEIHKNAPKSIYISKNFPGLYPDPLIKRKGEGREGEGREELAPPTFKQWLRL
jgi:hypothetical protein